MTDEHRTKLTAAQRQLTDAQLVRQLPAGKGLAVHHFAPYWDVVARNSGGRTEFIVTDSSLADRKPQMVHGPTTRDEATVWARTTSALWLSHHAQVPTGPFE